MTPIKSRREPNKITFACVINKYHHRTVVHGRRCDDDDNAFSDRMLVFYILFVVLFLIILHIYNHI